MSCERCLLCQVSEATLIGFNSLSFLKDAVRFAELSCVKFLRAANISQLAATKSSLGPVVVAHISGSSQHQQDFSFNHDIAEP